MRDQFTQEEANEILMRAIDSQPLGQAVSREQLESIAAEIGVSPEALRFAEQSWFSARVHESEERRIFRATQREVLKARLKLTLHFGVFLFSSFILLMANILMDTVPWCIGIIFPWFLALLIHASYLRQSVGEGHERAFRHWLQERRLNERTDVGDWASSPQRLVR